MDGGGGEGGWNGLVGKREEGPYKSAGDAGGAIVAFSSLLSTHPLLSSPLGLWYLTTYVSLYWGDIPACG